MASDNGSRDPETRARRQELREKYQRERPTLEQLVTSGDFDGPVQQGTHRAVREVCHRLRQARQDAGRTLADVAEEIGIDAPALSRLETGHNANPTIETIGRYAAALGQEIVLDLRPLSPVG